MEARLRTLFVVGALLVLAGMPSPSAAQTQDGAAFELVITLDSDGHPGLTANKPFSTREECLAGAAQMERETRATRGDKVRFQFRCEARGKPAAIVASPAPPPDRVILWQSLESGISPQEIVAALQTQGIRSQLFTDKKSGAICAEARDGARVAGRTASIELGCVSNRLFYVDLRYRAGRPGQEEDGQFETMTRALTQTYGAAVATDSYPDVVHSSTAGIVTRQGAIFEKNGLRVVLTVNDSSGGSLSPSETVIIRYWRAADADAFAQSESRKGQREQEERDRRLREGL